MFFDNRKKIILILIVVLYAVGAWQKHLSKSQKLSRETNSNAAYSLFIKKEKQIVGLPLEKEEKKDFIKTRTTKKQEEKKIYPNRPSAPALSKKKDSNSISLKTSRSRARYYTIRKKDSLWSIVKEMFGLQNPQKIKKKVAEIIALNKVKNPNHLETGNRLLIPMDVKQSPNKKKYHPYKLSPKGLIANKTLDIVFPLKHKILKGQTLRTLAKLYYKDAKKWIFIFSANRKKIKNPNRLPYGIYVTIPTPKKTIAQKKSVK